MRSRTKRGALIAATLYALGYGAATPTTTALTASAHAPTQGRTTNEWRIEFGNDSSFWANDSHCDDARFAYVGSPGAQGPPLAGNRGEDATDCRRLWETGRIHLPGINLTARTIDFGDNTSDFAHDNECDDPRFDGPDAHAVLMAEDLGRDATDCRRLYNAGRVHLFGIYPSPRR